MFLPSYLQVIAAAGALNYWPCDDPVGSATLRNPARPAGVGVPFDGADLGFDPMGPAFSTSMAAGYGAEFPGGDLSIRTLEMWFRNPDADPGNPLQLLVLTPPSPSYLLPLYVREDSLEINVVGTSSTHPFPAALKNLLQDGNTHHLVLTFSGTTIRVWADGAVRHSFANTLSPVGRKVGVGANYCNLALYDRVLPDGVITQHYQAGQFATQQQSLGGTGADTVPFTLTITALTGAALVSPFVTLGTGVSVGVDATFNAGDSATIDTATGTATITAGGVTTDATSLLTGSPLAVLIPGNGTWAVGAERHPDAARFDIAW